LLTPRKSVYFKQPASEDWSVLLRRLLLIVPLTLFSPTPAANPKIKINLVKTNLSIKGNLKIESIVGIKRNVRRNLDHVGESLAEYRLRVETEGSTILSQVKHLGRQSREEHLQTATLAQLSRTKLARKQFTGNEQ